MKKILLISYFFPPVTTVAGQRAFSWAKYFSEYGIAPTVIARHWSGTEKNWNDLTSDSVFPPAYEKHKEYEIYRLPSSKYSIKNLLENNLLKISLFSKLFYFLINISGRFNIESDGRSAFRKFIIEHLKTNSYDLIIVTSPPLNLIHLAHELHVISGIPIHVDFRDLWNNAYLKADYYPPFNLKLLDKIKVFYIKRWLNSAAGVSAVSAPMAELINTIYKKPVTVITNGFDEEVYKDLQKEKSARFRFSLIGTYYKEQDFTILIKGLNEFLRNKNPEEVVIQFVGLSSNPEVHSMLIKSLPSVFIKSIDRVTYQEAARYLMDSEVLYQSAWRGYRGIYTTKLFDFIATGNRVLIAPGDNDVMDELISQTNSGAVVNSDTEFVEVLNLWFEKWKKAGELVGLNDPSLLSRYTRKHGAQILARKIINEY